jgi:hypothetical protein
MKLLSGSTLSSLLMLMVVFSFSFFTGCNSSATKTASAIHGCQILTISEVEEILGAPVEQPPRETNKMDQESGRWLSMCNYYAPDANISVGIMIRPTLPKQPTPHAAYDAYVKNLKENLPDYEMKPVKDIGTKAVWNGAMGQLTIFEGSYMVIVSVIIKNGSNQEKLTLVKKLASALLSKNLF